MPTAPKLVAGLLLAALAFVVTERVNAGLPISITVGAVSEVNALIAFFGGWKFIGARVGKGTSAAITNGITGTFATTVVCLFVHAVEQMVADSMDRKYRTVFEAIDGAITYFLEYGSFLLTLNVLGLMAIGAIIVAVAAEVASHYWR